MATDELSFNEAVAPTKCSVSTPILTLLLFPLLYVLSLNLVRFTMPAFVRFGPDAPRSARNGRACGPIVQLVIQLTLLMTVLVLIVPLRFPCTPSD